MKISQTSRRTEAGGEAGALWVKNAAFLPVEAGVSARIVGRAAPLLYCEQLGTIGTVQFLNRGYCILSVHLYTPFRYSSSGMNAPILNC